MKIKKVVIFLLLLHYFSAFASAPLYANYKTDKIEINQFIGFSSYFEKDQVSDQQKIYLETEKKFFDFCYFTDALLNICNITGKKIYFCSQIDGSMLSIDDKTFLFAPTNKKADDRFSDYNFTNEYNNPHYIVQYICKMYELQLPESTTTNKKLFSLETKSNNKIDFTESDETNIIFFFPDGEINYSPCFKIGSKNYIGFYYSKADALKMKKLLIKKYNINSDLKEFPMDFDIINKAYFNISYEKLK